jgi:hypothetical protein
MPLVAFYLRHFSADFIICMCEFDFRQAQPSRTLPGLAARLDVFGFEDFDREGLPALAFAGSSVSSLESASLEPPSSMPRAPKAAGVARSGLQSLRRGDEVQRALKHRMEPSEVDAGFPLGLEASAEVTRRASDHRGCQVGASVNRPPSAKPML